MQVLGEHEKPKKAHQEKKMWRAQKDFLKIVEVDRRGGNYGTATNHKGKMSAPCGKMK